MVKNCNEIPTNFARAQNAFLPPRRPVGVAAADEGPVGAIGALLALRATCLPIFRLKYRMDENNMTSQDLDQLLSFMFTVFS